MSDILSYVMLCKIIHEGMSPYEAREGGRKSLRQKKLTINKTSIDEVSITEPDDSVSKNNFIKRKVLKLCY